MFNSFNKTFIRINNKSSSLDQNRNKCYQIS